MVSWIGLGACRIGQEFSPISVNDFRVSIRSAKKWTMRGAESFTPAELSFLPDAFIQSLLNIYRVIEETGKWPSQLLKSFVVFLPKEEGDIDWTTGRVFVLSRWLR